MPEQPPGDEDPGTPGIDPTVPHGARIHDYLLGGVTNFEVDRLAAAAAGAAVGGLDVAKASVCSNRMFLAQVVLVGGAQPGARG